MMYAALLFALLAAAPAAKKLHVSGRVVAVSRICGGGAAVTREMEEALPPPQPLAGKLLLVVRGEQLSKASPAARIVADADGKFDVRLPAGTWCIFDSGRTIPETHEPLLAAPEPYIDAACLASERLRCDEVVRVDKKNVTDVEVAFYEACPQSYNQPCYRGPMPP